LVAASKEKRGATIATSFSPSRNIKLIANPVAGGNALRKIRQAEEYLRDRGCSVDTTLTAARGDARKAAAACRAGDFDRIIAAGGDGTLNEVVNGLVPSAIPLGVLPLGTTNVFAIEANIPFAVERACAIALDGVPRQVCLGRAGEVYFLLVAGAGFDAEAVWGTSLRLKRWIGKGAYIVSGVRALAGSALQPMEVTFADGSRRQCNSIIINNGRLYAGRFVLTPHAALTEDALDVCLLHTPGGLSLLRFVMGVVAGRGASPKWAEVIKTRKLTVAGDDIPVQVDGDFLGRLPMEFEAVFGKISMVFPE
jgi:YegS/Rv2252/BmrU family lipid kinase